MILRWILLAIVITILIISYLCFFMAFYVTKKEIIGPDDYDIPKGKIYEPFRDVMVSWMKETRQLPHEEVSIRSFDGLTLWGKYYEYAPGAPIELMFHGYRGNAERDLCGAVQRCFKLGHSALVVDQRASGKSDGKVITFGINESKDCHSWVAFMLEHFGPDVKILLTGISMGAATVLMAAGSALPENVIGVLADCGYSSPKAIIKKVIRQIGLPADLAYPFVKLGARLYGGFDIEALSPLEAMEKCTVPVIFFHGETDDFVPCEMSTENYDACVSKKKLVTMANAGHGLCYPIEPDRYLKELGDFFRP